MQAKITTTIPVRNGQEFILQTLESLARQTRRPDRVVVLDNRSTDATPKIVREFKGLPIEFLLNEKDLGTVGNFNRCLDFALETDFLHILHADDYVSPRFYEVMSKTLEDCDGFGMAWCLDERVDEKNNLLSTSGKPDGRIEVLDKDLFLARKAEIGNQAFCATLLKTSRKPAPARFPMDMLVYCDMVFWPSFGAHCDKLVTVNLPLAQYRWHNTNQTIYVAPDINYLVVDAWRTMNLIEGLRQHRPGFVRKMKLKGIMAVRCGIMAKRFRGLGNPAYAKKIIETGRQYTGRLLWFAGQCVVEARELVVFKLCKRPRHPQNIFS
jgi:glycosyltransferase involved in cell wall biosynthesis